MDLRDCGGQFAVCFFYCLFYFFFFFSSRRRHTRCSRDWSSDVCSSDLSCRSDTRRRTYNSSSKQRNWIPGSTLPWFFCREARFALAKSYAAQADEPGRSEERRVGKECRARR